MNYITKYFRYIPFRHHLYKSYLYLSKLSVRLLHSFSWYNLKSLRPVSNLYGLDRGQSVDRYYMESFLKLNRRLIRGICLEVADDIYTQKFGKNKVTKSAILDIDRHNPYATIYSDLRDAKEIKSNSYDCVILTQVLQFIDDNQAVVRELYRILRSNGSALITVPCFSRADVASGIDGDYWRYTAAGIRHLFEPVFKRKNIQIKSWGNVLSGTAFWQGIAWEELDERELAYQDLNFPVLITIRATKKSK